MSPLLWIALFAGCASQAEEPLPDPARALPRVTATLEEAVRLDRERRSSEAREAWRRAHALFESDVEPSLRLGLPERDVAWIEHRFGLALAEIDRPSGQPEEAVASLTERLEGALDPAE